MATTVSLINMKGGVGKSTIAVNLAWYFARSVLAKKVLVVDLDPQFNASQYLLGVTEYQKLLRANRPTVWDIFEAGTRTPAGRVDIGDPRSVIKRHRRFSHGGRLDLIPSRLELAHSLKNPGQKERHLSKLLQLVEKDYDLILIDCAPTESVLTTAAYLASRWLLVPVKPEYLSTIGLPLLVNSVQEFKDTYSDSQLDLAGIVFNAATEYLPEEQLAKETVRALAGRHGWYVFEREIAFSRSYPKGAREGQPISMTSYSRSAKVINFRDVALEFRKRIRL